MPLTKTNTTKWASTTATTAHTIQFSANGVTAFTWTATAGRLLVAAINADATFTGTPTDNLAGTWTQATSGVNNTATQIAYKIAAGGETNMQFTITSATPASVDIFEYSGNAASSPLDIANSATGATTGVASPSITTTNADDLLIGVAGTDVSATWTALQANWVQEDSSTGTGASPNNFMFTASRAVAATGSYNFTITNSPAVAWVACIAAFKAAAVADPFPAGYTGWTRRPRNTRTLLAR